MLLTKKENVAERIVIALSQAGSLSPRELHKHLNKTGKPCSERAVYKELKILEDSGVAVQRNHRFSVTISWSLDLLDFSDALFRDHIKGGFIGDLPKPGEKHCWHFSDLLRLDSYWVQLIIALFAESSSKRMYEWVPHFWFELIHAELEQQTMKRMERSGFKLFVIIGDDSYIDRQPSAHWSRDVFEWSFAPGPFAEEQSRYYCVIDDYILLVQLDSDATTRIAGLCKSVKSKQDLTPPAIFSVFNRQYRLRLYLSNNKKQAARLRSKFMDYFGIAGK